MNYVYEHSVTLDESKCTGCTACLKHCPTEAIRIRDGHAKINPRHQGCRTDRREWEQEVLPSI